MNNLRLFLFGFLFAGLFLVGCGGDESSDSNDDGDDIENVDSDSDQDVDSDIAASTWEGHSLREEPGKKGKWLASVTFGEEMTLLGETEKGDKYTYEKVELSDGKKGWVRDDLIHKGGRMGAITKTSQIYKRPSISNISDNELDIATIVVIKQKKDEFTEFIAKNDKSNNRARGWVLGESSITSNELDIAVAVRLSKAMAEGNPVKAADQYQKILDNSSFEESMFYSIAEDLYKTASEGPELAEDEIMITGDNVNVRSLPNTDTGEKLFQLNSGDIVKILSKGDMDDIGGLNYWYEIKNKDGNTGWVFGKFTNKAL